MNQEKPKNRHGGPRPNSGRPRKDVVYESAIRNAEAKIRDRLPWLVDREFALAEGVRVQAETEDGGTYVYTTPPSRQAIEYLINRVMGKPTEKHDVTLRTAAEKLAEELGLDANELIAEAERIVASAH